MTSLPQFLLFTLLPAIALVVGSVLAAFRPPKPAWRSVILHFAAGVVFSVVSVELLPDIVKEHAPVEVALGFALGVAAMLSVRALGPKGEAESGGEIVANGVGGRPITGLLFGVGVDTAVDGLLLGIGFAAGPKEGVLLALALATELFSLGLATAASFGRVGAAPSRNISLNLGLATVFCAAALAGATLLSHLSKEWLELVLSFGLAALLFLVTEELLTEAHEERETPWHTATFFAGFLLFLLLGMML